MKVIFYAQTRQATGCDDFVLNVETPITESEFWTAMVDAFPGLAPHRKAARLARRETYLQQGDWLQPHDEIAVIPPVSGG